MYAATRNASQLRLMTQSSKVVCISQHIYTIENDKSEHLSKY